MNLRRRDFLREGVQRGMMALEKGQAQSLPPDARPKEEQEEGRRLRKLAAGDRHRPLYHAVPPAGTMGDPNGLIQYKDVYHLFYQHQRTFSPNQRTHWAHSVSADLFHWTEMPLALYPDDNWVHCYSGSLAVHNGTPTAFFTGLSSTYPEVPCMAFAEDGDLRMWRNYNGNPVIAAAPQGVFNTGFRDPYVWQERGMWFMGLGSGIKDSGGAVLLYRSANLVKWEYVGLLHRGEKDENTLGEMWECPSFFRLGSKYVLSCNKLPFSPDPSRLDANRRPIYMVGRYSDHKFTPEYQGDLDLFNEGWAPQVFKDEKGRWLLFIFTWCARTDFAGWVGMQAMPRQVTLGSDQRLRFRPVAEVTALRREHRQFGPIKLDTSSKDVLKGLKGDCMEIQVVFEPSWTAEQLGVIVRKSPDGKEFTRIVYDSTQRRLLADRSRSSPPGSVNENNRKERGSLDLPPDQPLELRIFLDKSVIEVFVNDGLAAGITRVYPSLDSLGIDLLAKGGTATVRSVDAWNMVL